jgi:Holliday junction resolvase
MATSKLNIVKSSGDRVDFDEEKLRKSLAYSGASKSIIGSIVKRINGLLYPSITTEEIYDMAYEMLMEHSSFYGARYKIKKALFELGPSGFPFEKYVNELLLKEGYHTDLNQNLEGKCISHEIDVVAVKDQELFLVECKFHSERTRVCNVKDPLYLQSRFTDVVAGLEVSVKKKYKSIRQWVVTNTRFTKDAIDYARCCEMKLVSWNYPLDYSLKILVDKHQLYPITSLSSLSQAEKQQLLQMDIVLCSQLNKDRGVLDKIGLSNNRIDSVVEECRFVCFLSNNGTIKH